MNDTDKSFVAWEAAAREQLEVILSDAEKRAQEAMDEHVACILKNPPTMEEINAIVRAEMERVGPSAVFAFLADSIKEKLSSYKPELDEIAARAANNGGDFLESDISRINHLHAVMTRLHGFMTEFGAASLKAVEYEEIRDSHGSTIQ